MLFTSEQSKTLWYSLPVMAGLLMAVRLLLYNSFMNDIYAEYELTVAYDLIPYIVLFLPFLFYLYNLGNSLHLYIFIGVLAVLYYLHMHVLTVPYQPGEDFELYKLKYEAFKNTYAFYVKEALHMVALPAALLMFLRKQYILMIPAALLGYVGMEALQVSNAMLDLLMDFEYINLRFFLQFFLSVNMIYLILYIIFMFENKVFMQEVRVARNEFFLFLGLSVVVLLTILPKIKTDLFSGYSERSALNMEELVCGSFFLLLLVYLIFWLNNRRQANTH